MYSLRNIYMCLNVRTSLYMYIFINFQLAMEQSPECFQAAIFFVTLDERQVHQGEWTEWVCGCQTARSHQRGRIEVAVGSGRSHPPGVFVSGESKGQCRVSATEVAGLTFLGVLTACLSLHMPLDSHDRCGSCFISLAPKKPISTKLLW